MFRRFSINFALFSIGFDAILVILSLVHCHPFTSFPELSTLYSKPQQTFKYPVTALPDFSIDLGVVIPALFCLRWSPKPENNR